MTTSSPTTPPSSVKEELSTRLLWAILFVVLIADVLDLLDSTITYIAAPTIVKTLGGNEELIKWLGASYALAMGILLVVGGRLGDKYGQRRLFLIGIAGFTLASTTCGLAINPTMLVAARLCQGGFGALLIPQGMAILTKTFPREMMSKAFSAFGPVLGISSVLGPIVAGFLIDANIANLGWRSIFLINLVLGGTGFIAATRLLPQDTGDKKIVVDALGSALLATTMLSLMYGLIDGSTYGWTLLPGALIVVGLVLFALFCWRQQAATNPLIEPTLFKNRGFTSGLILGLVFFAAVNGLTYVISLFFQVGLHLTPTDAALGLAPLALGIILASIISMQLITKLGRNLIFIGLLITLVGATTLLILCILAGKQLNIWTLEPAILVMGFGMGCCFGTLFDVAIGNISPQEAGSASGSLSSVQQLASGIGSAIVTSVYFQVVSTASQIQAMSVSIMVAIGVTVLCCGLVWLLPPHAQAFDH